MTLSAKRARKKSQRSWRKRIILASLGIAIGLLVILFFSWVYNPFGASLDDPLVLIPSDVDIVLTVEDLPALLEEVQKGNFIASLRKNPGLDQFLRDPQGYAWLRDLNRALKDGLDSLDQEPDLPFGLKPITDLSGRKLTIGAYLPEKKGGPWPFFCVIQPDSWLGIAGTNVLINRRLGPLFVDGDLKTQGITPQRSRDLIKLSIPSLGRDLFVTRIADAVLISSEERQLARIRKAVATEGIPADPAGRFRSLHDTTFDSASSDLWILARRTAAEQLLDLDRRLDENWGPDTVDLVRRILPRPGGKDLMLRADLDSGLSLSLVTQIGPRYPGDLFPSFEPHAKRALGDFLTDTGASLPASSFATVYLESTVRNLADPAAEPGGPPGAPFPGAPLIDKDIRKLLDEALANFSVGSFDGLVSLLDESVARRIGVVFFKQPRPILSDEAEAGYLLIWPLEQREGLDAFLGEVSRYGNSKEAAITGIRRRTVGSVELLQPLLKDGIVDDPRVTQHGLAVVKGRYLVYSNFYPYLETLAATTSEASLAESRPILDAFGYVPKRLLATGILDWGALDGYCSQSTAGWATQQTTPSPATFVRWRRFAQQNALRSGFSVNSPRYKQAVNAEVEKRKREELARQPVLQRDLDVTWRRLRSLFSSVAFSVESKATRATLKLRFDVPRPAKKK